MVMRVTVCGSAKMVVEVLGAMSARWWFVEVMVLGENGGDRRKCDLK